MTQTLLNGSLAKISFTTSSTYTRRKEEITVQPKPQTRPIPGTPINQSDITNPKIMFSLLTFIIVGLFLSMAGAANLVLSGAMTVNSTITWTELNFYSLIMWVGLFLIFAPLITVITVEGVNYYRRRQRTPVFSPTPREHRRDRPRSLPRRPYRPTSSRMEMPPLDRSQSSSQETPLWPPELTPLRQISPTAPTQTPQQVRPEIPETRPTSTPPTPPSISEMTKGIRRLEAKVKRLQQRVTNPKVPRKYVAVLGEKACKQEVNAQLLEALDSQRAAGRISARFYRRKRKQLTKQSS